MPEAELSAWSSSATARRGEGAGDDRRRSRLRCCDSSVSIPDGEAFPEVRWVLQFIDHRDGIVLHADVALAAGVH